MRELIISFALWILVSAAPPAPPQPHNDDGGVEYIKIPQ
jgi:hypothetical protein